MALRRAFRVNPGNPKTIWFIVAFLSPFADPAPGPHRLADPWPWPDLYGDRYSCYFRVRRGAGSGAVAGLAAERSARRPGILNRIAALVFAGLSGKLIFME